MGCSDSKVNGAIRNTFHVFEDWESEELFQADTAGDHVMGLFIEMGTVWGDTELGTDKAITMTVHQATLETVPLNIP